ncbi:MAG TPA: TetR/AcrR family transcriptional regulator [Candidatus Ozemobacteraceae bacterium]|nr:TetR/AcrR family transcriptional regulator [Candidatus Ozemobacteraceae bacterium]
MGRRPSDKREKILATASELFAARSFQDVKLDLVAEKAGVAKGTIYLSFKSKEDLFCECLLHDTPDWYHRIEGIIAENDSATARLRKLVDLQADAYARKGPLIQQMIQMCPTFPVSTEIITRLHDHLRQIVELDSRLFQQGIDAGEFPGPFTALQMAIIFIQIFDLNVKFQMFRVSLLQPEDVHTALLKLFGHP